MRGKQSQRVMRKEVNIWLERERGRKREEEGEDVPLKASATIPRMLTEQREKRVEHSSSTSQSHSGGSYLNRDRRLRLI